MEPSKYTFDGEFQTCVVALLTRDVDFCIRTDGLIRPEYFEDDLEASIVAMWLSHFQKYRRLPDNPGVIKEVVKEGIKAKIIRSDLIPDLTTKLHSLKDVEIDDREYITDRVVEFARHQALTQAIFEAVELIERGEVERVEPKVREASQVGADETNAAYDYVGRSEARKLFRDDLASGKIKRDGIPTGLEVLDTLLFNRGWGRRELTVIMGGAKAGKTTFLIDSARAASLSGFNVLYVSLEVASNIIAERLDANVAELAYRELDANAEEVHEKIQAVFKGAGQLLIHEFPSGSLTPKDLNRLINRYKAKGLSFDLVVVDYADLMIPDVNFRDSIENSKRVYIDLRAIGQEHNLALLTATQTNREGMKEAVAKMHNVADDINKVRTCDLLISINSTEDERVRNECRLFFAASRNQAGDRTVRIQQDLARGKFFKKVLDVE